MVLLAEIGKRKVGAVREKLRGQPRPRVALVLPKYIPEMLQQEKVGQQLQVQGAVTAAARRRTIAVLSSGPV